MRRYFARINNCGYTIQIKDWIITTGCRKQGCPICGGINHRIHISRRNSVNRRISNMPLIATRHLTFTVPDYLSTEFFTSRASCGSLLGIAKRNVESHFGTLIKVINQAKGKKLYRLDKPVLAALHLFGKDDFNPHVHVVIFEETFEALIISQDKLAAIKKSYQRALTAFTGQKIEEVDFSYNYHKKPNTVAKAVWYVTKPMNPALFSRIEDREVLLLLTARLKRFRFIRHWGLLSHVRYREQSQGRRAA